MKKLIRKYILSKNRRVSSHYYFYRWLADVVMDRKQSRNIVELIATWCFKNGKNPPFTDIFVVENVIYIYTIRPGLWIGKGGKLIDGLLEYINESVCYIVNKKETKKYIINLVETRGCSTSWFNSMIHYLNEY
jgi:hypothetical protein